MCPQVLLPLAKHAPHDCQIFVRSPPDHQVSPIIARPHRVLANDTLLLAIPAITHHRVPVTADDETPSFFQRMLLPNGNSMRTDRPVGGIILLDGSLDYAKFARPENQFWKRPK